MVFQTEKHLLSWKALHNWNYSLGVFPYCAQGTGGLWLRWWTRHRLPYTAWKATEKRGDVDSVCRRL